MSSSPTANPPSNASVAGARQSVPTVIAHQQIASLPASLVIFVLAAICFIFHLSYGPLAGTEGHRAITAEQMLHHGNYLLPRLYGHLYLMKPPLPYWLIAGSERLFGQGELTWRLPSALASSLLAAGICMMTSAWLDSIAGLVAGLAFIGLIPLWSQNRSADVDAINHLGCVMAALAIIDMSVRLGRIPAWVALVAIFGTAVSFLSKGPAGLPIILGAVVGVAIANRDSRSLRRVMIYVCIVAGIIPLAIWAALAYRAIGAELLSPAVSGADEASTHLFITSTKHLYLVLALPFTVLAYGMPISALLVLPFMRRFTNAFDTQKRRLIRGIAGCVLGAFLIQMFTGMNNPRYAFLDLPVLCPLAGALVFGARHHFWPGLSRRGAMFFFTCVTFAYCSVAAMVMIFARRMGYHGNPLAVFAALGLLVVLALAAQAAGKMKWCAALAVLGICSAALVYGVYKSAEEKVRSAQGVSAALAAHIPAGEPVLTWNVLLSQPELFYYAHLQPKVERPYPNGNLPTSVWLVLDDDEWALWQNTPEYAAHLSRILTLHPYKHIAYVCWYSK
jgi:4-amino-4-deoxy-L-arabinose transferase-like glycosyltransferase